jgi:hypothetical protein
MATYSKFLELQSGSARTVDLSNASNILAISNMQLLGSTSGYLQMFAAATTTSYTITWPSAQGSSGQVLTDSDGAGTLTWSTPSSSGANTALSNLSAVAINTDLLPGTDDDINLGSDTFSWAAANIHQLNDASGVISVDAYNRRLYYSNGTAQILNWENQSLGDATGVEAVAWQQSGRFLLDNSGLKAMDWNARQLRDTTGSATQLSWSTTGVVINTAMTLNGSTSGTFTQQASATTTPYTVTWPSAQGSTGQVLTDSDGAGTLTWTTPAGTGANTALSNLAAVAINTSLLPGSSDAIDLGSASFAWRSLYAYNMAFPSGASISLQDGQLLDTSGQPSVDWLARALDDASGVTQASWSSAGLTVGVASSHTGILLFANPSNADTVNISAANTPSSGTYNFNLPATVGTAGQVLASGGGGSSPMTWVNAATGSVTSVSVVSINGFAGTVATATSTPAITISTTVTGLLLGNGTGVSAAPTTGSGSVALAASPTFTGTVATAGLTSSLPSFTGDLNMNSNQINNLASPSASTDAANKGYVDAAVSGLTWKGPVAAYAASNVPLTGSTPLTIDGHLVANNDLLLLGNQTTASQNGEYSAAVTGGSYVLTANGEPTDAGDAWLVLNGTAYGDSAFVANAAVPLATFTQFAGPNAYIFSAPLVLTGNTVTITQASGSANGYLSSTDWNTFNNKQPAGNYITALTGDATASGPGSAALTLATVNTGPGTFAIATVTVNGKGLVTSASAASTTGSGAVVLAASPSLTGTADAINITMTGDLVVPTVQLAGTYNGAATLAANTTYALRWGIPANSETAGDLYVADWSTSSFDLFWVAGLYNSTSTTATGASVTITTKGSFTLASSDATFVSANQGKPVWLGSAGAFTPNSTFSPAVGDANFKLGIVTGASTIWVDGQMMGVS